MFLKAFVESGTVTHAAAKAGMAPDSHNVWLKEDPTYADRFELAKQGACDRLEHELLRRGVEGDPYIKYGKDGEVIEEGSKKSDACLIFALKGWMPDKYRERIDVNSQHVHLHAHRILPGAETASLGGDTIARILETLAGPTGGQGVVDQGAAGGTSPA